MNDVTPEILALRVQEVAQMSSWVAEYYQKSVSTSSTSASSMIPSTSTTSSSSPTLSTVYTITSCAPSITNCPGRLGQVTTEIITLYTTSRPESTQPGTLISTPTSIPLIGIQQTFPTAYPSQSFSISANATATLFPTIHSSSTQVAPTQFTGAAVRGSVTGSTILFLGILVALFC
jgi:chitinase